MKFISKVLRKIKYLVRKWLYLQCRKNGSSFRCSVAGSDITFYLHPHGQIAEAFYTQEYEQTELALVTAGLRRGMNVIDVGANIGLYSIVADKLITPGGRVWSFEPSSETFECLVKNISLNNAESVIPVKMGLADTNGDIATLRRDPGFGDGERYLSSRQSDSRYRDSRSNKDSGDSEVVQITTLDHYVYTESVDMSHVDFIKMDVEGGEYDVLLGAQRVLVSNPNIVMMFEFSPVLCALAGHTQQDVYRFLSELDFQLYAWNRKQQTWDSDKALWLTAGNIWACRNKDLLPRP